MSRDEFPRAARIQMLQRGELERAWRKRLQAGTSAGDHLVVALIVGRWDAWSEKLHGYQEVVAEGVG